MTIYKRPTSSSWKWHAVDTPAGLSSALQFDSLTGSHLPKGFTDHRKMWRVNKKI